MKWKLILLLSLSGVFTGVITLYVLPARFESVLTTPVFLLCAYFIARRAEVAYFLHGLLLGAVYSALVTAIHVAKADIYFANHHKEALQFAKMGQESGATVPQAMMLMGIFSAVVSAIVMGLFAIAGSKILKAIRNERM